METEARNLRPSDLGEAPVVKRGRARIYMGRARIRNMGQARIQNEVREHMCNINTEPVPGAGGADGAKGTSYRGEAPSPRRNPPFFVDVW